MCFMHLLEYSRWRTSDSILTVVSGLGRWGNPESPLVLGSISLKHCGKHKNKKMFRQKKKIKKSVDKKEFKKCLPGVIYLSICHCQSVYVSPGYDLFSHTDF